MEVTQKIEELERELNLKKALLAVKVAFDKGTNPTPEIRAEVEAIVKSACIGMADRTASTRYQTEGGPFSDEEIAVLKAMAAKILSKAKPQDVDTAPPAKQTETQATKPTNTQYATATLLTLDNVHRDYKGKIPSGAEVRIVGKMDGSSALVETIVGGYRFNIPIEDLDIPSR